MYNWIGKNVKRKEDYSLLRGKGSFIADLKVEGMMSASFLRSIYAHAVICSIDTSKASQLPGVFGVWTSEDLGEIGDIQPLATLPESCHERVCLKRKEWSQPPLAKGKVRFVGEPIAVVLAENQYIAEDAVQLIEVEYKPLEAISSSEQSLNSQVRLFDNWENNVQAQFEIETGNWQEKFVNADIIVERTYRMKRSTGVPIECRGVLAQLDPSTGHLVVWSSTQVPHFVRDNLADALARPAEEIRVIAPDVGGGFGIKGNVYPEELVIPYLVQILNIPIKWVEDRLEHMKTASHARDQIHYLRAAFNKEGTLLAIDDTYYVDSGAYNLWETCVSYNSAIHLLGPYRCKAYHSRGFAVLTNKSPSAPYRGAGRPEAVFAMERLLEEAAGLLSIDRLEIRRKNLIQPSEMPYDVGILYRDGKPAVYDSGDFPSSFNQLLKDLDYPEFLKYQQTSRSNNKYVGLGLALFVEGTGIGPFEGAVVGLELDGTLRVATGTASQGQSHKTTFAQICSEVFNVDTALIRIEEGDTNLIEKGIGTFASRSAVVAGSAIYEASRQLKVKLHEIAAQFFDTISSELSYECGNFYDPSEKDNRISLQQIAKHIYSKGRADELEVKYYFYPETVTYSHGVHAAMVEVDIHTGKVDVQKYYVVHDCGVEINPQVVEGQLYGGVMQGLGGALFEELIYDDQGQLVSGSLQDYLLPNVYTLPEIKLIKVEHHSTRNALGIKGTGEGGAICPPAAVANAVVDALEPFGVQIHEIPLKPELIKSLLRESEQHRIS